MKSSFYESNLKGFPVWQGLCFIFMLLDHLVWVISHEQQATIAIIMRRITKVVGGGDGGLVLEAPRPGVCGEGLCSARAGDRILQAAHTYAATLNTETMLSNCMRPNTAAILNVL